MRTEQIMLDPVGALLHLERWCNDGSPSGLSFGEHQVSPSYRPRGDTASFPAPSRTVPWAGAEVSMAAPSSALVREIVRPDGVVLVMHPDNPLSRAGTAQVPRMVAPTASARTVAVLDSGSPYYAKLHYPGLLGRVPREMDAKRVRASVRMSAALDQETALLPDVCAYLPESIGIVTRLGHTEQGVVYREFVPRSRLGGDTGKSIPPQVPLFSLFSTDIRSPTTRRCWLISCAQPVGEPGRTRHSPRCSICCSNRMPRLPSVWGWYRRTTRRTCCWSWTLPASRDAW